MQRYYFDIHSDRHSQLDETGTEFSSMAEVRKEAMRVLPALAAEEVPKDGDKQGFTVLVTDSAGRPVYSATLSYIGLNLLR
ncbi:hypothetical protein NGM99_21355 [Mesorhizobium sp. RP14(2022)]|uniref:DUF6894 domain-containing protein n=1 Tax=Mesorhizobium liriopis TaxID=2953882 RepID=A0ABT1CDU3_9HYPH|nr:hypothetical protein [Mesorhizobium liriopis]MCO6052340.1 hypothetical protein [Mesorhizobium liriopis]